MLMILSGHVVDCRYINCQTNLKSFVSNYHNFINTSSIYATEGHTGSYLVFNYKREDSVQSGAAATGMR